MSKALSLQFHDQHQALLAFIRQQYPLLETIPLHTPVLGAWEKQALNDCIDSDFVSSVGPAINAFEQGIANIAKAKFAVATVNGTAALQLALLVNGVSVGTEVITQAFTFVGTANAISHCGAKPVFIDINRETLGLCPRALRAWLQNNTQNINGTCLNKTSGNAISACVVMHSFGHPAQITELLEVCQAFSIALIEDAAEAVGSLYQLAPVGCRGSCGVFSFNGNKIITTGGGGALITNDVSMAQRARHLATTAKQTHAWHFYHDEVGFNFRLPNLNASLGLAQLKRLPQLLQTKRQLASRYRDFIKALGFEWVNEPEACQSNYWLNAILCADECERDNLLATAHDQGIYLRPAWQPLHQSPMYVHCQHDALSHTEDIAARLVNLPSGVMGLAHA